MLIDIARSFLVVDQAVPIRLRPVVNTGTDCFPGLLLDGSVDRVNAC
jgi:hypothetical protein